MKRMVRLPMKQSDFDKEISRTLENEDLSDEVKRSVLERQIARLKAILDGGRPGWQEEVHDEVFVRECRDPIGPVAVSQHGDIE